tara:strand:- start:1059 stop:1211 length:153 start_codon:yes stop_codon:yes gene_type:complete
MLNHPTTGRPLIQLEVTLQARLPVRLPYAFVTNTIGTVLLTVAEEWLLLT